jgi:hypothetical protein
VTTELRRILSTVAGPLAAVLQAPARARGHPRAVEVRFLLDDGWSVRSIAISTEPSRGVITLVRDGETRVVADNDLGFTAYATWLRAATPIGGSS